ncbi:MAG: 2-amino-4-hydroxy-6-hydroxymethyldihydropteridine diphosphokinase [Candidatus Methylomirabilales bacterium]
MIRAYIGLGSNLGDRRGNLERAISLLGCRPEIRLLRASSLYETEPMEVAGGRFFNAVLEVETSLAPQELLETLSQVEEACGRARVRERGEARSADMDLLLYASQVIPGSNLEVPHPRMHLRRFVLAPLSELDPDLVHPGLGIRVGDLLTRLPPVPEVRVVARDWLRAGVLETCSS